MRTDILREKFLDFFKNKNHRIVDSDSLVPKNDPTVLFTPAGMNQFKEYFLSKKPPPIRRVASCQRCLRTDDLDKVGKTPYHHTFFEMLGNFSFGDYFKKEAIGFAWEFLTEVLKIKPEKLWVSVYTEDEESYDIWSRSIKVPVNRIVKLDERTNFWPPEAKTKGPDGPCGPCSEIFFDWGKGYGCGREECNPSCGCERFVEVWNLVFTQFNRKSPGVLEPLPKKNIDTGMGLERIASVMQGVETNFKIDIFSPIINEIVNSASLDIDRYKENVYAIADYIRAITFAIYDGVVPSNEERGYIVRKLIRRGITHLRKIKIDKPFLYRLVPVVAITMQKPYPQLLEKKENISQIILEEEKNYLAILDNSQAIFKEEFKEFLENRVKDPQQAGRIAFRLYDTYGIPLELTEDFAAKAGFKISSEVFEQLLLMQRRMSQQKTSLEKKIFAMDIQNKNIKPTKFLGYTLFQTKAKVLEIEHLQGNFQIILDSTVFYPEAGGQVGDTGTIEKSDTVFEVLDTQRKDKVIIHIGRFKTGRLKKGDNVLAKIDLPRRLSIARNHTATHLLQSALRKILGEHVQQQGSYVGPEYLRFDFSHFKQLTNEEIMRIEELVNEFILKNDRVEKKIMSLEKAKTLKALAFFDEKYESKVRVVSIGDYSKELCAGTHLDYTCQIGIFKINSFSSVAQGIKRIEAQTGLPAYKRIKEESELLQRISEILKTNQSNIISQIDNQLGQIKELDRLLSDFQFEYVKVLMERIIDTPEQINGIKVIFNFSPNIKQEVLRRTVDFIKEKTSGLVVILLVTIYEDTVYMVMGSSREFVQKGGDVSLLIKEIASEVGGSGGGRKDFAQGSGPDTKNVEGLYLKLKELILRYTK